MNDKLYIIGNGFDLHHNLNTSYEDFRDSFVNHNRYLSSVLLSLYGTKTEQDMWWSSFEEMLSKIDYLSLLSSSNGFVLGPIKSNAFFTNNLPVFFEEWIKSIDVNIAPDKELMIDPEAQFFTFNYTMLLEKVYGLNECQIWHIHGSLLDHNRGTKLIIGHDSDERRVFSHMVDYESEISIQRIDIADDINRVIVNGAKKVKDRIAANEEIFHQRYSRIRHYVSMGFSFNDIDMPYIEKLVSINEFFYDADWLLYSHSDQEKERLNTTMRRIGVDADRIKIVNW